MVAKLNLIAYLVQKAINSLDSFDGLCTQHDASCCRVLGWGLRWGFNRGGGCLGPDPCCCCSLLEERVSHPMHNEGLLRTTATEAGE